MLYLCFYDGNIFVLSCWWNHAGGGDKTGGRSLFCLWFVWQVLQVKASSVQALVDSPKIDLPCKFCDKICTSKRKLREHIITVHGERMKCNECDKTFSSKTNLRIHEMEIIIVLLTTSRQWKTRTKLYHGILHFNWLNLKLKHRVTHYNFKFVYLILAARGGSSTFAADPEPCMIGFREINFLIQNRCDILGRQNHPS